MRGKKIQSDKNQNNKFEIKSLTPSEIVRELNKYIVGQDAAKKAVAIALRNRWRRQKVKENLREEILPNNIILIGPTGVGKTEIARRLARLANAPFLKVEASKYTEVGYVGRDVESMIREITDIAVNMVKAEKMEEVREKAQQLADERILDILLEPIKRVREPLPIPSEVETQIDTSKEQPKKSAREFYREKLIKGELDDTIIEFEVQADSSGPVMQILGPFGPDDLGVNLQEILGNVLPKKTKKRKMTIKEARNYFREEESKKLIDMDAIIKEAIFRVENTGIIFIDEIDKIAGPPSKVGPDVSREGVQRDLLPIVEGSTVNTKYGPVRSDHILFIASGAFHVSKPSDLIPELQGRFPIRVELHSLTEEDFVKILTLPENALIKQYTALLKSEGVEIEFEEDAIREIAKTAAEVNEQVENIGARRLHTILTILLEDILYGVPDQISEKQIRITKEMVQQKLSSIVKNRDLSKYIL
ncbi:MAG: ATP-dependent protease ATPase subunit HslU [Ignavibacteria bacterium]|nr:ATP-dependent protease ATPase subunit HslU [Ignavibacteria bacterium]